MASQSRRSRRSFCARLGGGRRHRTPPSRREPASPASRGLGRVASAPVATPTQSERGGPCRTPRRGSLEARDDVASGTYSRRGAIGRCTAVRRRRRGPSRRAVREPHVRGGLRRRPHGRHAGWRSPPRSWRLRHMTMRQASSSRRTRKCAVSARFRWWRPLCGPDLRATWSSPLTRDITAVTQLGAESRGHIGAGPRLVKVTLTVADQVSGCLWMSPIGRSRAPDATVQYRSRNDPVGRRRLRRLSGPTPLAL